jgi:hypothetical protein
LPKDETGVPVSIITQEFPPSRGQPRVPEDMLAFRSPAIRTGNPLIKQESSSALTNGRNG